MKKTALYLNLFAICSASLSTLTAATPPTPPPQAASYSLVFYDDFINSNQSPDGTGQYTWFPGIWWESYPAPFPSNVSSSVLNLAWNWGQSPADTTVSSCSKDGLHCRSFRYGYFEARMRWDVTTGAWPAFWMMPVESIWGAKEYGELDIFEGAGDPSNAQNFFGTIHDWVNNNGTVVDVQNNNSSNKAVLSGVDFSQWHTYGVLWVAGRVTWYFDNQPILTAQTPPIFDQQNYYLMLGSQEGVNWQSGNLNGVTAGTINLYVDWVKVWQVNQPLKYPTRILM